jgi:hypothetical protein
MRVPRKGIAAAGASVAVLGVGAAIAFAPIVRARIAAVGTSRRLDVEVGRVSAGWFAVTLREVRVRPSGVAGVSVVLPEVRVELGALLSPSRVEVHGGDVLLRGSAEELESSIRTWRGAEMHGAGESRRTPIAIEHVGVRWTEQEGDAPRLEVDNASLSRANDAWEGAFERAIARHGNVRVEVNGGSARADEHGALAEAHASSVAIALARTDDDAHDAAKAPPTDPAPPPLPPLNAKHATSDPSASSAARLPLPDLHAMRARLVAFGAIAREHMVDGAHLDVDALALELGSGERRLAIGQGPLSATRSGASLDVTFTTRTDANGTPLALKATVPLEAGDAVVSLAGGPISLARLGFDEGAAGLVAVDRTTVSGRGRVSLAAAGDALTFEGDLAARGLAIDERRVAAETVRGIDVSALARGVLDDHGVLRVDDVEVALGALRLVAHGSAEQTEDHLVASLAVELPSAPCQSLLQSIPAALVPTLDGAEMEGTLGAHGRIAFDSRNLDDLVFAWDVADRCGMSAVPEGLAKERFTQPFEHAIYEPDGTIEEQTTGPTSDNWTDLDRVSPFMQVAVLTTEDGAFYRHQGFNRAAMRNALVADLKAGRFVRGASTITMQLAKNLFLSRDKTVSRKLEEVILADYLESAFTKPEMMELYLNIIEFGPGVYGITQAAAHYFGRAPAELNLAECLFLSSILPSPIRYGKLAEKPQLSESWTKHLRELMTIAAKLGTISDAELTEGLKEEVTFHDPKDPAPEARPFVTGTHFQATNERTNADWEETPAPKPTP